MEKGEMGENATGRLATYYVAECMEFNRYGAVSYTHLTLPTNSRV